MILHSGFAIGPVKFVSIYLGELVLLIDISN